MSTSIAGQKRPYSATDEFPLGKKYNTNEITLKVGGKKFSFNKSTFEQDSLKRTVFEVYAKSRWTPQQKPPQLSGNAEIFEKFIVPYIKDSVIPNFSKIESQEILNSLVFNINEFKLNHLLCVLKKYDIDSLANANWSEHFPMPHTIAEEDKKRWALLSLDKKIQAILQLMGIIETYNNNEGKVLKKCWAKSKECSSGKQILEIRRACLDKMSEELRKEKEIPVVLECLGGNLSIPRYYKKALVEGSIFFVGFFSKTSELTKNNEKYSLEVNKDAFQKLLNMWSGNSEEVSTEEVFDLLMISHAFDLEKKSLEKVTVQTMKTWVSDDEDDISNVFKLATYSSIFFDSLPRLKDILVNFLIKIYFNAHRKGNTERVQSCLNHLNRLNIKTLDLSCDIQLNDEELQILFKCCQRINDKSEDQIATLTNVISLDVSGCNKLTDQAMGHLATLSNLTSLDVSGCNKLTDQAMGHLAKLTNLTSLGLSGCNKLTDQAMGHIAKLANLISLNLSSCRNPTDQAMEQITTLTNLTSLNVSWRSDNLTDRAMVPIAKLLNLTSLNVESCFNLTDQAMVQIDKLTNLTSLNVSLCTHLTDQAMGKIAKLTHLTSLNVSRCNQLTDLAMGKIAKLTDLTNLNVSWCDNLKDQEIKQIATLTGLTRLDVSGCKNLTGRAMEQIAKLNNLTSLNLSCCQNLVDQALVHIATLNHLTNLDISGCDNLTHLATKHIVNLTKLKNLNVGWCDNLSEQAMEQIAKLPHLTSLNLSRCKRLTDQAMVHIAKLTSLTSLDVSWCQNLTDQAMEPIAKLPHLTSLNVSLCTNLTDQAMVHIAKLPHLTSLRVSLCDNLTDQAMEQVAKLPNLMSLAR